MDKLTFDKYTGQYYNEFGSIVYPNMQTAAIKRGHQDQTKLSKVYKKHCFQEFEIQAVAYSKLRDYFKNDNIIKGEYTLSKSDNRHYCRCDIAIFDKETLKLSGIIEVKRGKYELNHCQGQINNYSYFCSKVIVISSMPEAENIVNILKEKEVIS